MEQSNNSKKPDLLTRVQKFIFQYRYPIAILLIGLVIVGVGALTLRSSLFDLGQPKVEVLGETSGGNDGEIVVEVSGAVEKPGVYKFQNGSRIEDALVAAGGLSADANREYVEKTINRAAILTDGQKIYVPKQSEVLSASLNQSDQTGSGNYGERGSGLVNINSASQKELEELPGIGPVYASNIIEQRPYSSVEELLTKGVLKEGVYNKIKDLVSVY
ncbi:helix-hairpin-helix domain-containing protein [Candidatus Woesebacteria bacterium]|nr:helix-hairpin-helix domain-containing protein [Candidatus Woesebacteria bacterium]